MVKSRIKLISAGMVLAVLLCIWIAHGNQNIGLTAYEAEVTGLPLSFEGLKVVQLSDLHNVTFKDDNKKLISIIADTEPDMIFITGDMLDSRKTNMEAALDIAQQAVTIAPTYYVPGNHESRIKEYAEFESRLVKTGITVLRNSAVSVEKDGEAITIAGVDDPDFLDAEDAEAAMSAMLNRLNIEGCALLLSHRPELFDVYADKGIELTFSGHTHGGQIRLPFLGGLYAPGLGFFPEYDGGLYHKGSSTMVVSRGIGNSLFPFRVNNDPEVVLAILRCK